MPLSICCQPIVAEYAVNSRPGDGLFHAAGGDYLEPGYLVLWFTCIQLSYADWRDHRDWFNQCVDDRDVSGGCTQYPESIKYFRFSDRFPYCRPGVSGGLIFLLRRYWSGTKKRARIHLTPAEREKKDGKKKPPFWTRIALILSAIGVAFSHGANDGQKGIGLVMLVLIGVAPAGFVVNMNATGYEITRTRDAINNVEAYFEQHPALLKQATGADQLVPAPEADATQPAEFHCHPSNTINALNRLKGMLTTDVESYDKLSLDQRSQMRRIMLCVSDTIDKVVKMPGVSADDQRLLRN